MPELNPEFVDDIKFQVDFHIREKVNETALEWKCDEPYPSWILNVAVEEAQRLVLAWIEVAVLHHNNEEYYKGLLNQIGETIGEDAYICDDGSKSTSILRAKLPRLVQDLKNHCDDNHWG